MAHFRHNSGMGGVRAAALVAVVVVAGACVPQTAPPAWPSGRNAVVTTLAGFPGRSGSTDGPGALGTFHNPDGVAVDQFGNVFVADSSNSTIRKVTPTGVVSTFAGTAGQTGSTDGIGATARFGFPGGLAADTSGNLYVADGHNTIRKVTPSGVVSTIAGTAGESGSADGTGAAARFDGLHGIAVDSAGNVYVAEQFNNTIRKVTPSGVVSTIAGTAGESGSADGTGAAARFNRPLGIAVNSAGTMIYVSDSYNSTIRKVTPDGVVTTFAGYPEVVGTTDAVGTYARFYFPYGLAVDGPGNVYVADLSAATIRQITPEGAVTTLAGYPREPGTADGTGTYARFSFPAGVVADGPNRIYVSDSDNSTIRKITITP